MTLKAEVIALEKKVKILALLLAVNTVGSFFSKLVTT
jgi:hypothetical protein